MITGDIRNRIDQIWNAFWAGGIANPLEVIEQITYLLFIRRLDDLQTLEENKANRLKQSIQRRIFPEDKLGSTPKTVLIKDEHSKNNLPDVLARWPERDGKERQRPRTAQSFCVPKADIAAEGYDLSLNRYKEVEYEAVSHDPPKKILVDLAKLEREIQQGMKELEELLG